MLQEMDEPYEVVLNLFNEKASILEGLAQGHNPNCIYRIQSYRPPAFFNISAANNLGLARSTGAYVIFSNSDIIYPRQYLRTLKDELFHRDLYYALGARVNLGPEETAALPPASDLTSFEFLVGRVRTHGGGNSCWTIRRDIALQVGGFDPEVLCHEDLEFNDRVIHYLRRKGLQAVIFSTSDLLSFHLHHGASELYTASEQSRAILEPRRERLQRDPNSEEDVVMSGLDDPARLLGQIYDTVVPPVGLRRNRIVGAVRRRLRGALTYLVYGTLR
jgi:hypothetical protein